MILLPTKSQLDGSIQAVATECERHMIRWQEFAERMDGVTNDQLTAMGYSENDIAYIRSFVVALKNIALKYHNETPLNADDPSYMVGQFASMMVI